MPMDLVALDCETMRLGDLANTLMVVRVTMIDKHGEVLYDTYVKPTYSITSLRAMLLGYSYEDLMHGTPYLEARQHVACTIRDRLLVGYNVDKVLEFLEIGHPRQNIRDIAKYTPLVSRYQQPYTLKILAFDVLGSEIHQDGKNNSVESAKSAMEIYLKFEW